MTIDQLNLSPLMARRAQELQELFPSVFYTSGRRDLEHQAHAMACQVVTDRTWIRDTYLHAAALQTAVDQHPECTTVVQLEALLADTLRGLSPEELAHISDHLAGNAVDLHPLETDGELTPDGQGVMAWVHDCPDTKTFLTREGGKVIWHWSIRVPTEV